MDCAQFDDIVHDLERAGTQGAVLRANALAHAESCNRCGLLLEDITSLDFALDAVAIQDANEQASSRVEVALLEEFRRQHAEAMRPQRNFHVAALAIAAALILALGLVARHWTAQAPNLGARAASTDGSSSVRPAVLTLEAQTAASSTQETATADQDSEYATNFVSLPYADDPGVLEGDTVVRVTLSREALASFGLPVVDVGSTEQIPADIALSEDGVPQAIRLVADADLNQSN